MKKFKTGILVAAFLMSIFAVTLFAQEGILKIAILEGEAFVKLYPSTEWVTAKVGQMLKEKDSIKTAETTRAYLEFPDRSGISIKGNSEVMIGEIAWNEKIRQANFDLGTADVKTIIKKSDIPAEFALETTTSICKARGTIFTLISSPIDTKICLIEGSVELFNKLSGKSFEVVSGCEGASDNKGNILGPSQLSIGQTCPTGYIEPGEPYTEPSVFIPNFTQEPPASGR